LKSQDRDPCRGGSFAEVPVTARRHAGAPSRSVHRTLTLEELGHMIDDAGGTFTMGYTALVVTATRTDTHRG